MSGKSAKLFADFEQATGPKHTRSPDDIINAAAPFQQYTWDAIYRNNKSKSMRVGDELDFPIVFEDNGTYENRLPGQWHDWKNPQRLKRGVLDWRFALVHKSWNEVEIKWNGTFDDMVDQFARISSEKEMLMQIAAANGVETDIWGIPDYNEMEVAATTYEGKKPYSMWAHINPEPNGLYGSDTGGGATTGLTAFAEKQRLVPSSTNYTQDRYRPQLVTYDSIAQDNTGNPIAAMEELFDACMFKAPETFAQYWEDASMNNMKIYTSKVMRRLYRSLIRGGQDRLVSGPQDPAVPDPLFRGIPLKWAKKMDTSAVYKTNGAGARVTEGQTTASNASIYGPGPRAMFANHNFLFMQFCPGDNGSLLDRRPPSNSHNQFDNWVVPCQLVWNLLCQSYMHQGFLTPAKNTALFSAY